MKWMGRIREKTTARRRRRSGVSGSAAHLPTCCPAASSQVLKTEDLSSTQYNVLRILRGSPDGLPCGEIANRMITRDPDITRLLDRLEKRGLISRCRETKDRRMVMARITPEGLKLLGRLDEPVAGSPPQAAWAIWGGNGCGRWPNCCRPPAASCS